MPVERWRPIELAPFILARDVEDDEVLQGHHIAFHAEHLGDVVTLREPSRKVTASPEVLGMEGDVGDLRPHRLRRHGLDGRLIGRHRSASRGRAFGGAAVEQASPPGGSARAPRLPTPTATWRKPMLEGDTGVLWPLRWAPSPSRPSSVFLDPYLSGDKNRERRVAVVTEARSRVAKRSAAEDAANRREAKDLETRQMHEKVTMRLRLEQATGATPRPLDHERSLRRRDRRPPICRPQNRTSQL